MKDFQMEVKQWVAEWRLLSLSMISPCMQMAIWSNWCRFLLSMSFSFEISLQVGSPSLFSFESLQTLLSLLAAGQIFYHHCTSISLIINCRWSLKEASHWCMFSSLVWRWDPKYFCFDSFHIQIVWTFSNKILI